MICSLFILTIILNIKLHCFPHFYFAELAKRFTKQKSSKKVSGKSLRSKIGKHHSLTESSSMSNLFNDTTRLRLGSRPSLSNMFSHEAPLLTRPKDPPPPPPPVEQVLLPVTPPRKCFPLFTSDELKRINSVINGQSNGKLFIFCLFLLLCLKVKPNFLKYDLIFFT